MKRMIIAGAVGLAAVGGAIFWQGTSATNTTEIGSTSLPMGAAHAQEASDIDTSGIAEMTIGPADAKVTIVEYASFTCPHCANFHQGAFKQLKAEYLDDDQVQFIYRDVYFDRFGLWASMVARCGGEERFFGISDMIYSQQKDWLGGGDPVGIANNLRKIGKVAGLGDDQVEACLADTDKAKALVAWYQENATKDEINSTPSFIINGQKYDNMSFASFKEVIDEKLAE